MNKSIKDHESLRRASDKILSIREISCVIDGLGETD